MQEISLIPFLRTFYRQQVSKCHQRLPRIQKYKISNPDSVGVKILNRVDQTRFLGEILLIMGRLK